jgi:ERCC4-type nuclease
MTILVSPAEPAALRKIGPTSPLPETLGADFLIVTDQGFVGVQRKEVRDLVASIRGDRIARELGQSGGLLRMVLIVEGDWAWDRTGSSRTVPGLLKAQYDGFCLSIQSHGWWVLTSETMTDTIRLIGQVDSWWQKPNHGSLYQRPKSRALWGTHRNREWGVHWWQAIPGVGVGMAGVLYDHVGVPVRWTIGEADLLAVPGIGKGRAAQILAALDTNEMVDVKEGVTP